MRIAYCTNVRLPSERAHGHQIAQVCDALVQLGHEVEIFAPFRRNAVQEDYWSYYGAQREVHLTHLGSFDPIASPLLPGVVGLWTMNAILCHELRRLLRSHPFDLLYTRTPALLPPLLATGRPTVLEIHQLPRRGRSYFVHLAGRCAIVACLTSPIRDELLRWGVLPQRLIVEGDAVDLRRFAITPTCKEARTRLKITTPRTVVGYVGRLKTLGWEKGVGVLLEALARPESDHRYFGLIVGGPEDDRREYEARAEALHLTEEDLRFTGEVAPREIPLVLAACDILVMPFPDLPHYRLHMSPLKMFEYMASGKPIITSDLPTIRDVLSEETAVFFPPGNLQGFLDAIRWVRAHPEHAQRRTERARALVEDHTWEKRMGRILKAALR